MSRPISASSVWAITLSISHVTHVKSARPLRLELCIIYTGVFCPAKATVSVKFYWSFCFKQIFKSLLSAVFSRLCFLLPFTGICCWATFIQLYKVFYRCTIPTSIKKTTSKPHTTAAIPDLCHADFIQHNICISHSISLSLDFILTAIVLTVFLYSHNKA